MTKILYITNGINGSGGLERVLSIKTSKLAEDYNYEVHILSLNENRTDPFYDFSSKIRFISIALSGNPIKYYRIYRKSVQKVVNDIQPAIISVCDDGLKGFFIPSIIKTKAKIIYERHASIRLNTGNSIKGKVVEYLMQRQAPKFDRFIVLTPSNGTEWKSNNLMVIPNPLSFKSTLENPLNQKRIIAVGSHSWNKGYDLLLRIWKPLEEQFSDWRLDIFGAINENRTFVKMAKEMNLEQVFFHNPVKNIQLEYEQSSLLVLPSRSEGFGMVLIEAMECGVPCIAFDCPSGPGDIISSGQDGILVPELDTDKFEKSLNELMIDDDLRKSLGLAARLKANRYSVNSIVKKWDDLFKQITET